MAKLLNCRGPFAAALHADCFILYFSKHYSVLSSVCMRAREAVRLLLGVALA